MKKILISVITLFFLLSPISAVLALDFNKINLKTSLCAVETNDLYNLSFYSSKKELDNSDKLAIEKILNNIRKNKNTCYQKISKIKNLDNTFPFINNQEIDACAIIGNLEEKNSHYLNLLNFTLEELNKKGYQNEQQIKDIIKLINVEIAKINPICKAKSQITDFPNPISASDSATLLNYYKDQTNKLSNTYWPAKSIIPLFKKVNETMDLATREYFINYGEFSIDNVLPFISKLSFEKGIIKFNEQSLQSFEEKTFDYYLNNLPIKIITTGTETKIQGGKINIISEAKITMDNDGIFVDEKNINKALENFLKNKFEKQGEFSLFISEKNNIVLQGKFLKDGRILGIFKKKAPTFQSYSWFEEDFVLENQNRPWWFWLTF